MNLQKNNASDDEQEDNIVLDYFQAETMAKEVISRVTTVITIKAFAKILKIDYQTLLWIKKTDEKNAQQFPDGVFTILQWAYPNVEYQKIHAYQFNPDNDRKLEDAIEKLSKQQKQQRIHKWEASVRKLESDLEQIPDNKENHDQRRILKQRINNTKRNLRLEQNGS